MYGGYKEILPFVLFGFANMLNYGIYSGLWSPFSLKTFEPDKANSRVIRYTPSYKSKKAVRYMLASDRAHWNIFCAQSETRIRMRNSTGLLRVESQGLSHEFLKPFSAVYPDPYSNFLRSEILGTG